MDAIIAGADDRQHQRACPSAGGRPRKQGGDACIGRSRGGLTTKLHLRVNEHGLPLQLELSAGQVHDAPMAELLLRDLPEGTSIVADKGYDADWIRDMIEDQDCTPVIPPKSNRTEQIPFSPSANTRSETSSNAASTSSSSSATSQLATTASPQPIWLSPKSPPCDCGSGFMSLQPSLRSALPKRWRVAG